MEKNVAAIFSNDWKLHCRSRGSHVESGFVQRVPEESRMNISKRRSLLLSSSIAIVIFSGSLAAQGFGQLKDIMGGSGGSSSGGAASSLGSLGSLGSFGSLSSITSGSTGNVAGIIEYCVQNNLLGGSNASSASSVKDQLMGKLSGTGAEPAQSNPDYINGAKGILSGSSGQSLDLSMAGLKAAATKQICQKILDQGKSLL